MGKEKAKKERERERNFLFRQISRRESTTLRVCKVIVSITRNVYCTRMCTAAAARRKKNISMNRQLRAARRVWCETITIRRNYRATLYLGLPMSSSRSSYVPSRSFHEVANERKFIETTIEDEENRERN